MQFKLLNLNLYEGGTYLDNILKFFDQEKPDILCLQEIYNGTDPKLPCRLRTLENLKQHLPQHHYHYAPELAMDEDHGPIDVGNAIFSRFPIIKTKTTFLAHQYGTFKIPPPNYDWSIHPHNMHQAVININGTTINVFNLHGIWGRDGADNPTRLRMSQIIVDQIKDQQNVILTGDFNLRPNTQTINNIEQHLTNIFKDKLTTTFNIPLKRKHQANYSEDIIQGYAQSVVDMIFTSSNLKLINKSCPHVDVSDHLPLICTFEI